MSHIFISYSHKDKEYVHQLQQALQKEGFDAWIDDRIDYADEWLKVIEKQLDTCDAFIIVMSQSSYESDMVQNELARALKKRKPIFPILLEGECWFSVQAKQYLDLRDYSLPLEKFYGRLEKVTPRNKLESPLVERLEKLKSQATRYELVGDLWNALNIWYEIRRLDSHYPRVDRKIDELEAELHRIKQESMKEAIPVPDHLERTGMDKFLHAIVKQLTAIKSDPFNRSSLLKITGFMSIVVVLLLGGMWLISRLAVPSPAPGVEFPFVFTVATGDDVSVCSYDIKSNVLSVMDLGPGKNWDPTYSPLGNLYFTSDREDDKAEIYRLVNGVPERVTHTPGSYQSWDPVLSPSGTLYYTSDQRDGRAEIYRLVNEKPVPVTDTPGDYESWGPVVSSTGTVYFTSDRNDGRREVYRLINGQPQPVTDTPGDYESWGPAIGLTGIVYFTSDRGDSFAKIYRLVENGEPQPVTYNTSVGPQSWGPVIAADGTIYYTSTKENGKRKVFMLVNSLSEPLPEIPGRAEGFTDFLKAIYPIY